MSPTDGDHAFTGAIPEFYERFLVPLIFEPYAVDLAARAAARRPRDVLELAAGTGVLTRRLAETLPVSARIVASDLNEAMIRHAQVVGTARAVGWRQADAMSLPFEDASFDLVCCQFGVMFFPDRAKAYAEARRVLRPGGTLLFNTWGAIADNGFADAVTQALALLFPDAPPRFMARIPHGYNDKAAIARDLEAAGFAAPFGFDTVDASSRADSARDVALAYCHGTPLRNEIEARDPQGLDRATGLVTAALVSRYGNSAVAAPICAHVVTATGRD